ncbi:MAG: Fimbrillin-A associated anchor protein Mfa1 and Mfa2 [Bacteroidetes bacterium]|nr:Fimbrillin-A associated anchor protein Mfa1 and Mfa2 [Bacteroidota bacterium]
MKKILLYLLPLLLFASCSKDDIAGNAAVQDSEGVKVGFSLKVDNVATVQTRSSDSSVDTTKISNVWVVQFVYSADGTGALMGTPQYLDATTDFNPSNMEVKLKPGTCNVYFVANTFNASTFNSSNCGSETLFKGLCKSFVKDSLMQYDLVNTNKRVPMTCKLSNFTASATAAPATTVNLVRSAALVDFAYNVAFPAGQSFTIEGARVCNVPNKMYYADATPAASTNSADYYDYPLDVVPNSQSGHIMFYLPENLCGNGSANTDSRKKIGIAGKYCTYVELRGRTGDGKFATYKMYLGKDNLVNYDVQRNYFYKVDLTLNGISAFDGRINSGTLVPTANCYMVLPGQTIVIPATERIKEGWTAIKGTATNYLVAGEKWTADLLWTDNSNGLSSTASVASVKADPAGGTNSNSGGYIWVTAGSVPGNSVIVARRADGTIAWSWHIWVTDYNPGTTPAQGGTTYSSNTLTFMDRNLGATTSTPATLTTFGLLYQWGRKDPFPGASAISTGTTTPLQIYAADKTLLTQGTSGTGIRYFVGYVTLTDATKKPYTFVAPNGTNNNDWCNPESGALWGSDNGGALPNAKTVYDPCPVGWRVPCRSTPLGIPSPWDGLTLANRAPWNLGSDWTNLGAGYYPASGYREQADGTIKGIGTDSFAWCATSTSTTAYGLWSISNNMNNLYTNAHGYAFSVRCVKE